MLNLDFRLGANGEDREQRLVGQAIERPCAIAGGEKSWP
jgi:hypothetical protein